MTVTLNEILALRNKTVEDISEIYRGKDNWCRCGCGGKYYYPGDIGFTRIINSLKKGFECLEVDAPEDCEFINLPYDDSTKAGKAVTIYFK